MYRRTNENGASRSKRLLLFPCSRDKERADTALCRRRVAKIEQIDEVEELNLILEHYAVSWGNVSKGGGGFGLLARQ